MKIAIPQLNYHTGKIKENYELMLKAIKKAKAEKAELIVFPELAVCGAFPKDLLEKENFIEECRLTVDRLGAECGSMAAIIGAPNLDTANGIMYNSAYFIENGEVTDGVHKTILSDYDIFNESRYFVAGEDNTPIRYKNQNIRIIFDEYEAEDIEKNDSIVIHIGTTPFTTESFTYRQQILSNLSRKYSKTIISVNHIGGNTDIVFDGNSMIYNFKGQLAGKLKDFEEDFTIIDTARLTSTPPVKIPAEDPIALIHKALVTAMHDYFRKNGFTKAILGLSGGIDSAVVAALAAEAIGKENVTGLLMPSVFSTDHSIQDATDLAQNIGMPYTTLPIKNIYDQYIETLSPLFKESTFNVAEENLQARTRGALVMAVSNKFGMIALNTSNKSEAAVGYSTLYGDMCGSLAVIGDVYKTDIYKLAHHINRNKTIIPQNTLTKAPSAELRPDQKDQDSLPEYKILDNILQLYIEENLSPQAIIDKGHQPKIVNKIIQMVDRNEYKRAQCPPVIKVTKKTFGQGRQMPF